MVGWEQTSQLSLRLSRVVLWEILAMIFQSLTVLCLGMVQPPMAVNGSCVVVGNVDE